MKGELHSGTATHDLSAQLHTYAQCTTRRLFAQNFWQNWAKICGEKWPLYIFLFTSNLLTPAFLSFKPIAFQPSETEAWGQNGKFTTLTFSFTWVPPCLAVKCGRYLQVRRQEFLPWHFTIPDLRSAVIWNGPIKVAMNIWHDTSNL